MKHFYNSNTAANKPQPIAKATGTAISGKLFTLLLLGFFLLVSGESNAATFTAVSTGSGANAITQGNWNVPATWGITVPAGQIATPGVHYPGANDDVIINITFNVIVPAGTVAACNSLELRTVTGQGMPSIDIFGSLTVNNLNINAANNGNGAIASVNIKSGGTLKINSGITAGPNKYNFNTETNSTVIYGAGSNILAPRSGTNQNAVVGNPKPYHNLVVDNTGNTPATLSANVTVNGNLSLINGGKLTTGSNTSTTPATPYVLTLAEGAKIATTEDKDNNISGLVQATRVVANGGISDFGMGASVTNNSASNATITIVRTTGIIPMNVNGQESATRTYLVSGSTGANISANLTFLNHELTQDINLYKMYNGGSASELSLSNNVVANGNTFIKTGLDNGLYTIAGPPVIPLPVELVSFNVKHDVKGAKLVWATASELDNKGFEVQMSTDSRTFVAIGFVESKVGTTSLRQDYSFLDTKAVSGTRYYRLKQIDLDSTTSLSPIRAIVLDGDNGTVAAYPNPFSDVVMVKLTGTESRRVKATLTDAMGKVMLETTEETTGNSISVNTHNISTSGMYMLHVYDNDTKYTFKLMKR
ncbi:T9SS type A sorting domain-containing protein [Pontibacter indicus]|uniref:Por secretion system C-terminal sorting domain-containing protein n=1 Tax=Pontibacter indicus TaxID=1317125 RepID=A0A1R3XCW1_9BACT|nr:T9SS type A sorting domain-containing protein [Pontibacter indicus]SIT88991.1 Por secretion system C-terminal sorting domain-containing protein [Pontibacter indicus]